MARYEPDNIVTQSFLDRLIDNEPKEKAEAPLTHTQSVRALKNSLKYVHRKDVRSWPKFRAK